MTFALGSRAAFGRLPLASGGGEGATGPTAVTISSVTSSSSASSSMVRMSLKATSDPPPRARARVCLVRPRRLRRPVAPGHGLALRLHDAVHAVVAAGVVDGPLPAPL